MTYNVQQINEIKTKIIEKLSCRRKLYLKYIFSNKK